MPQGFEAPAIAVLSEVTQDELCQGGVLTLPRQFLLLQNLVKAILAAADASLCGVLSSKILDLLEHLLRAFPAVGCCVEHPAPVGVTLVGAAAGTPPETAHLGVHAGSATAFAVAALAGDLHARLKLPRPVFWG